MREEEVKDGTWDVERLYQLEAEARAAKRGLWFDPHAVPAVGVAGDKAAGAGSGKPDHP